MMRWSTVFVAVSFACWGMIAVRAVADDSHGDEFFEKRIRPVLAGTCFRCHGGQKVSGELRVDSREALLRGGESGPAIDLDRAEASLLIKAIRRDDDVSAMPPEGRLSGQQVADFVLWVKSGAAWPKQSAPLASEGHWAFQPLRPSAIPQVQDGAWARTTIDRFILARLEASGIKPAPPADRRTLLRRVTYDLTGLPPTPDEVAAFEQDESPQACAAAVERLLASRQYGEHWGRHWLDLVRYADTAGENTDHPLPHAWRYRNWVIEALNEDLPYDEFVREQIAGDLLASQAPGERYADQVVATGYLAIARRFGHDIDKDMHLTHEDVIDNLGKTFLGLTLGCCRCHDHKYDPLSVRDYYGLYGIFDSTRFAFPGCEPQQKPRDLVPLLPPAEVQRLAKPIEEQLAAVTGELSRIDQEQQAQSRQIKETAAKVSRVLSSGQIEDGGAAEMGDAAIELDVKQGEVIELAISPRGNHGADSTLVDFRIASAQGKQRWDVRDLISDLLAGNPHADEYGNAAVWCFLDARESPAYLPESLAEFEGHRELRIWRNGDTPSVFVNASEMPLKVWTTLPAKSFFMHPGPGGPVALGWISPINGRVSITGRVADAHPGGDGIGWVLSHFSSPALGPALASLGSQRARIAELRRQSVDLNARRAVVPVAYAVAEGSAHHARIHKRGEPTVLGEEVPRKFLDLLGGDRVTVASSSGRLELAHWLTRSANPLTARVIVNRVWQWHFGRGLVATPSDFGLRGAAPTHPELLDHLAGEFVRHGWSLKWLHRQIVHSAVYQQAAAGQDRASLYAAFPRRRLTAEELRDTMLAASGELDRSPGQAHPFPAESTWSFTQHNPFAADYETLRRSVYVMQKRNRRSPFFALFDGPDPNAGTPQRDVTTVPTQALFFLNDPFFHARAEKLAQRILATSAEDRARLDWAMQVLVGRPATSEEQGDLADFFRQFAAAAENPTANAKHDQAAWTAYARILLSSSEVLHVD